MNYLVGLEAIGRSDVAIGGGKGANLGELIQAGFPVPPGFVVTAEAYQDCVQHIDFDASPAEIRRSLLNQPLPKAMEKSLVACHEALLPKFNRPFVYAVRSSATAEDLGDASFAGQHDTYYYVTVDQLSRMIKQCWASLWSDAACGYRESQGISHREVSMAVVVQVMIEAEVSGITFTANPVNGNKNELVTEASWGMGAAIVDGRVSPDQIIFNREHREVSAKRVADKKFMVATNLTSDDSRLTPVPTLKRRQECLSPEQLNTVITWAEKAEAYFGAPQDLEWSFETGEFYLLQSRPITTLANQEDVIPDGQYVLFKPMAENFTDPLLPLSQDIFLKLFPILTMIRGRAYLNVKHIRPLLPFKMSDQEVAELAYLSDAKGFAPRISILRSVGLGIVLAVNYLIMAVFYFRTANLPDDFMGSFRNQWRAAVDDDDLDAPGLMEKLFFRHRFFEPAGNMPLLVNLSAPRYIFLLGVLSQLLKRWLPDLREDAASYLTSGTEGILSTDMGRQIWQLAEAARSEAFSRETILAHEPREALGILRQTSEANHFSNKLQQFLAIHGHRTLKEFELNSVRWQEDPTPVVAMVKNYLQSEVNPALTEAKVEQERQVFAKQIQQGLRCRFLESSFGWRWQLLEYLRRKTKYFIRLRENSRFYHIMVFYGVRLKVLKMEAKLLELGRLKCKDDIFYLTWTEILALDANALAWLDVESRIRERRMEYIRLSKISPAKTFGIEHPESIANEQDGLIGQGASPGVYQGIARVIMDPGTDATVVAGEILIAPYTDPAWTPLFLTASAAVVEVGSYLSHAGTIAREYGMPCVVDVEQCTARIKTGDKIRVDGSKGIVNLLETE